MARQYNRMYKNLYGIATAFVLLLLVLSTLWLVPTDAQLTPTLDISREQGLDARITDFFTSLKRGNLASAFDELLQQSAFASPSAEPQVSEYKKEAERAGRQFGEIQNWERFESRQIGSDIVLVRFILKYDRHPVMWTFLYYRKPSSTLSVTSPGTWELFQLYFDTNFSERR